MQNALISCEEARFGCTDRLWMYWKTEIIRLPKPNRNSARVASLYSVADSNCRALTLCEEKTETAGQDANELSPITSCLR